MRRSHVQEEDGVNGVADWSRTSLLVDVCAPDYAGERSFYPCHHTVTGAGAYVRSLTQAISLHENHGDTSVRRTTNRTTTTDGNATDPFLRRHDGPRGSLADDAGKSPHPILHDDPHNWDERANALSNLRDLSDWLQSGGCPPTITGGDHGKLPGAGACTP